MFLKFHTYVFEKSYCVFENSYLCFLKNTVCFLKIILCFFEGSFTRQKIRAGPSPRRSLRALDRRLSLKKKISKGRPY
jgi:hypothetical protein